MKINFLWSKPQKGRFEPENKLFSNFSVQIRIPRAILPLP
jgi:hypothetical protein